MADARRPAVFTVPLDQDLVTAIARDLILRFGSDPMAMSDILILLPNNRARTALSEAFVREQGGGILLPRMTAIGDLGFDETLATLIDPLQVGSGEIIPPAISDMERRFMLTGLIRQQRPQLSGVEAIRLATSLAQTIDQLDIEEIPPSAINAEHLEGEMAEHWNRAYVDFIELLAAHNREIAKRGFLGPSARRNALLDRLTQIFAENPPQTPVMAVGISTAAKAIARVLRQVARLPAGQVILPFVDLQMDQKDWDALGPHAAREGEIPKQSEETHPQFHLKLLLDRMGISRNEVSLFGGSARKKATINDTVSAIFCSASGSETWGDLPRSSKILPHVRFMAANDVAEESRAIAILMRQALETPEKRVALITPDRELATRTAAQLKRWNIDVDDSAGSPLAQSPSATLVLALADLLADEFGAVTLLAVLKHPLVAAGDQRMAWLAKVRQLDLCLRGPRTGIGLQSIAELLPEVGDNVLDHDRELHEWWAAVTDRMQPISAAHKSEFSDMLSALIAVAEDLSGGAVWKGEAGRQLARVFEELTQQDHRCIADVDASALPIMLARFFEGEAVRPPYGRHPRVAIWGLLEARMQRADMVICAGLSEGQWPQLPQPDPWLPPRLRRELGLPGLDRNTGLSAHDLASALGAYEVVISRSERDRAGPTVASRFWLRISALLGENLKHETDAVHWARVLDKGEIKPLASRPDIRPSLEQRKVDVSVTQVDTLKADPYSFYASKILRLKSLRSPGTDPDYAWRGTVIHALLEDWANQDGTAPGQLLLRSDRLFASPAFSPILRTMWQPRIRKALQWVEDEVQKQAENGRSMMLAENWGSVSLCGIRLTGKVDRIDQIADGTLAIVDYKTGAPPSKKQITANYATQLGLLGLIAQEGGFADGKGVASRFEYWTLKKKNGLNFGKVESALPAKAEDEAAAQFVASAKSSTIAAFENWILGDAPFVGKLNPDYAQGTDYDQLMRLDEWYGREGPNQHG